MANTAHIYKSKSGNYNISFHHPIVREGSIGKKIHRGLKVTTEAKATALKRQMDELLTIADETPSLLPTRSNAIAEGKYARVIIDAFYDCMTPEPVDYLALRDRIMPMQTEAGTGESPCVLVVGVTGAGKSQLIQHLLQTTAYNFPMRGAGRTTVSDTEVIVDDVDFSAVITFFSQNEIRQIVRENIVEACAFAQAQGDNREKIATKLFVDADKRFRFNYVLGELTKELDEPIEDDEPETEREQPDFDLSAASAAVPWAKLESCVEQVISLTEAAIKKALAACEPNPGQDEPELEEDWIQHVDQGLLDELTEEILEELERRLCAATGQHSWPVTHRISHTADMKEFFRRLQRFYQNQRALFGALVTPLVQGIRVCGRFFPPPWAGGSSSRWVLIDGQGVGHERGTTSAIDRTIPPELTKKYSGADLICLVDRAMPAMQGDAPILLEDLITRGFLDRLAIVFTHFEAVKAPDLDVPARKTKVLEGLSAVIQGISLPKAQKVLLEKTAESKAYFLSRLNGRGIKTPLAQAEMKRLCQRISGSVDRALPKPFRPEFNEYQLAEVLRAQIEDYRRDWSSPALATWNYKVIEALTNWIGHAYSDGYPKKGLYPAQNLSRRLVSAVSIALEQPQDWDPREPEPDEESRILNAIRNLVGDGIDAYCREVLVRDPRTTAWLPAYENISGRGTKVRRARTVARILEDRAQLPEEGMGEFTKAIWKIVQDAIEEVCAEPEAAKAVTAGLKRAV
jgi:hypothetical protein